MCNSGKVIIRFTTNLSFISHGLILFPYYTYDILRYNLNIYKPELKFLCQRFLFF